MANQPTRLRVTVTPMASANSPQHPSNMSDVYLTEHPAQARWYLDRMYDYQMSEGDMTMLWYLVDPDSVVSGLSWTIGDEAGYHLAFDIQADKFAVVSVRDVK